MPADIDTLLSLAREVGGTLGACAVWDRDEVFQRPTVTLDANQLAAFAERIRQDERERACKACETVLDMKEEARAEQQTRLKQSMDDELRALRHYGTVSTFNAGIRRCISAIRSSGTSQSNPLRGGGNG